MRTPLVRRRRRRETQRPEPAHALGPALVSNEAEEWIGGLRGSASERRGAIRRLHALLLHAARFEVARRTRVPGRLSSEELDATARKAADDALAQVLASLAAYSGMSRFSTWACKFALREAAVALRLRDWQARALPGHGDHAAVLVCEPGSPDQRAERREIVAALRLAIRDALAPEQREVLVALALDGVPIDVLAERLGSTRGALYQTLHDARCALRTDLAARCIGWPGV